MSDTTLRAALALHRAAQTWTTHLLTRTTNAARCDRGRGLWSTRG